MLQVNWATAGQGRSQCGLHKAKKHNMRSGGGLSFYERPGSESCCSGPGVQKHSHLCCCCETRIKVAKESWPNAPSTAQAQESCWQGRVEDGSTQHTRSTAGSFMPVHTLMCNTYTESSLLLRIFCPWGPNLQPPWAHLQPAVFPTQKLCAVLLSPQKLQ